MPSSKQVHIVSDHYMYPPHMLTIPTSLHHIASTLHTIRISLSPPALIPPPIPPLHSTITCSSVHSTIWLTHLNGCQTVRSLRVSRNLPHQLPSAHSTAINLASDISVSLGPHNLLALRTALIKSSPK